MTCSIERCRAFGAGGGRNQIAQKPQPLCLDILSKKVHAGRVASWWVETSHDA